MYFTVQTRKLLLEAARQARAMGHSYVGSVHVLLALGKDPGLTGSMLRGAGLDWELSYDMAAVLWGKGSPCLPLPQGYTGVVRSILRGAGQEALALGSRQAEPEHILLSLLRREGTQAATILRLNGVEREELFSRMVDYLYWERKSPPTRKKEGLSTKLLEQYCEDLVQKAASLDPVIGRDQEIEAVIGILCRKNKNNPALVGEPGVGKTAIAEGLAQRMGAGNVPPALRDKRLVSLNMANLVAGTKYRGEFEERVRDMLAEIRRCGDIILFVDEMHTIVGAGAAEGAIDAANIFKPALGRGELQMLGATTLEEYRKYIEKDPALERRFRPVRVEEPSREATLEILRGLKPGLEQHHHLRITEEALGEAVRLSVRYLPEQFLPDKAIDLLDEGAAHVRLEQQYGGKRWLRQELEQELHQAVEEKRYERAAELQDRVQKLSAKSTERLRGRAVTGGDIAWAVSARTGIPVGRLTADERQRLLGLEETLSQRVLGQPEAVTAVAQTVRSGLSGLRDENRPVACLLLTGPTGVGKTELCRGLAQELYGSVEAMIRLDMSEYMEKHTVARLIGAPPGYVGYEDGGKLTEAVRRRPYCLVLLDELEKAHPDVAGILLQIMEEGVLTDSTGRKVSFRNAIVAMTCNLGGEIRSDGLGFQPEGRKPQTDAALRQHFTPEFLGRLDKIVCFHPLQEESMTSIAEKFLAAIRQRAKERGIALQFPRELAAHLGRQGKAKGGAREIRRVVEQQVEEPLAVYLLGCSKKPGKIRVSLKGEQVEFLG